MENASDALIMATDILIFIVALTLCISSFTNVRQGVDNIINRPETIKMAKDSEVYINYIASDENKATRVVGVDTVIPSLYRALKENYVVYIKVRNKLIVSNIVLYEDLKDGCYTYKFKSGINPSEKNNTAIDMLCRKGLYNELQNFKFYEYLGEFKYNTATNVEDRTTYRIITYIQI